MGVENAKMLVKSEKISQNKKIRIVWAISVLLLIVTITSLVIDYIGYKEGQKYGLVAAKISGFRISENDSYAEQCYDVYQKLDETTYDFTINGVKFDASEVRESERELREAFENVMKSAGFDRYSSYRIAEWFKYTNIIEYFIYGYSWYSFLPICCYVALAFSLIFTILVSQEAKKELVVYEESVLCVVNPKKSKHLVFEDINNVDFGKNSVKLVGTGVKFKISNLINAENIKSVIIEKKKFAQAQGKSNTSNIDKADELKKYKELLEDGVISQEEFDAKKKQVLGL